MKRSIIATGVAFALMFGAVTSSAATTITFPPDIPASDNANDTAQTKWAFKFKH
ncbi:hypothetical protein GCM10007385_16600 [Tateyamaria omphalii]|uniref:hypothetical protein n=1 Tax=Tateyamaria omphalii TaxID=299262 RepID=UPI00167B8348|nr:hypothetical protein [Tateyamaria omphalii]GGX49099.1 hypothetical protein GCM10007385_16600 [Tateyamaria omphalii]